MRPSRPGSIRDIFSDYSINPFGNSNISVSIGNTIVSFACFGVGPSVVAYSILKILEENKETKEVIPYSNPLTLPFTAFILNRVFNMNILGILAAGGLYACYQFIRGNSSPAFASTSFKNLMDNVSQFFDQFIQKTRYTIKNQDSMIVYKVYLPQNVEREDVRVCWTAAEHTNDLNSFCVYILGPRNSISKYVECPVKYAVDPCTVIVSYSIEMDGNVLNIRIPKCRTVSVLLNIH